ncbi:hypothetical protein D9613_012717 [Agrocybe pediades]|uniref:HAT C-terminal dimerisation domain-containing protein n=1 Tax=Agrocybe pediades TaxID=84607 RepID=A0A8H4QKT1_9AGAR|nr:hypothetical protein D9613_012717 [Agrocybe pediades]
MNQNCWLSIFKLALDILPIQGSAVACEHVFSSSKETVTPRQNRMKPKLMEALQILKFTIKKDTLHLSKCVSEEDEIEALEQKNDALAPENIAAYQKYVEGQADAALDSNDSDDGLTDDSGSDDSDCGSDDDTD